MISNLLYLLKEFKASVCEPEVQARLAAKVASIPKINTEVSGVLATAAPAIASVLLPRIKTISVPMNKVTLARLKKPIGRPTDAASAQTRSSRKLMFILIKMAGKVA